MRNGGIGEQLGIQEEYIRNLDMRENKEREQDKKLLKNESKIQVYKINKKRIK